MRGFSTDSMYIRPPNVAERAVNIQKAPDGTLQLRRGYQAQTKATGGLGMGTIDDPATNTVQIVYVGMDGYLYKRSQKQFMMYYDGRVTSANMSVTLAINNVTQANPAVVTTTAAHNLTTGNQVLIREIEGLLTGGVSLNNLTYTITVTGANTFQLNGIDTSGATPYVAGGIATTVTQINTISNAAPAVVTTTIPHGLVTGAEVVLTGVVGMMDGTTSLNGTTFTITVTGTNTFSLNGTDTTLWTAYTTGGSWAIAFTDGRYLDFSIYVDPQFIYAITDQSINCKIIVNRAGQVNGTQTGVNTINVQFGHNLTAASVVQFYSSLGVLEQRSVTGVTPTSITINGAAVTVLDNTYINEYFIFAFGKGFDVSATIPVSIFLATITTVPFLTATTNGDLTSPAAFIQILENVIIPSASEYAINYWYPERINTVFTTPATLTAPIVPLPGSANVQFQNSDDFEIASTAVFDDVMYIANGWDYPQKYDGQTIYKAGMPLGIRPQEASVAGLNPFPNLATFQYLTTYEQVDNLSHIAEGVRSEVDTYTNNTGGVSSVQVNVENLVATSGQNWNTHGALATGGAATSYGPDGNGFFYNLVSVVNPVPLYTLKIGDSAYYGDTTAAVVNGAIGAPGATTITVDAGHALVVGDRIYFNNGAGTVAHAREVTAVTATTISINGAPVTVANNATILAYKTSEVFGNVAIVDGDQLAFTNTISVLAGYTLLVNDIVEFTDSDGNVQRRTVTAAVATAGLSLITIDGLPVKVNDNILIQSTNQRTTDITLQRRNSAAATLGVNAPISNNLRINIYRTEQGATFGVDNEAYLVASIPNNSLAATQTYLDQLLDAELGREFELDNENLPNPPPISKYVRTFGNQMFYAGGERGKAENSDRVFFSLGNEPEAVNLSRNFYNFPSLDDDVTGIGVSGSTFIVTKQQSIWAISGNIASGQVEIIQVAPGTNIGCIAHASIASVGTLMYFLHTTGVYALSENQLYPTDAFGNPVPISLAIENIFRETNYVPQNRYVFKRATAINYTKDLQYLLFIPCEDSQSTIRTANSNSVILCYDYQNKNWFSWTNMNAAGGFVSVKDDLYFQERRFSTVDGNTANLYKQHRFYRLVDHADHAGAQFCEWLSSWEDLGQPEVRKKFSKCILLMDRLSEYLQFNNPSITFSTYLNRLPNLKNTIATISQVDNIRNSSWSFSGWGWNFWSGYQDSFVAVNLKQGTVAKSIQVGITLTGINMDMRLAGYQLEAIPENRMTVVR